MSLGLNRKLVGNVLLILLAQKCQGTEKGHRTSYTKLFAFVPNGYLNRSRRDCVAIKPSLSSQWRELRKYSTTKSSIRKNTFASKVSSSDITKEENNYVTKNESKADLFLNEEVQTRKKIESNKVAEVLKRNKEKETKLCSSKGTSQKRRRATNSNIEKNLYWKDKNDEFIFYPDQYPLSSHYSENEAADCELVDYDEVDNNGRNVTKMIKFTVHGNPQPLRRHRTSRGFMYNPSASKQMQFRNVVMSMLPSSYFENLDSKDLLWSHGATPLFQEDEGIAMTILFRQKRPKSHFVGNKPGPGRLRPTSPNKFHVTRTDVDNLIKFVLDSLNGLLYIDDRQVLSIHATKVLDMEGDCEGATEVLIRRIEDSDIP